MKKQLTKLVVVTAVALVALTGCHLEQTGPYSAPASDHAQQEI